MSFGLWLRAVQFFSSLHGQCDSQGQYIRYRLKNQLLYLCLDMLKTYQRETKFFEFSRETNTEKLEKKKKNEKTTSLCNGFMLMALLQWLLCNGFRFSLSLRFTSKSTIFLDDGLYQKIPTRRQGPLSHWECSVSSTNLFIMATGQ